jgi:hypothetical protein
MASCFVARNILCLTDFSKYFCLDTMS